MYHYTSRDTALEHILSTRKIRLGPLSKTNDPRETKSWTFGIPGEGDFPASLEEGKAEIDRVVRIFEAAEKIRANCKVLCMTMDDPTYNSTLYPMNDFKRGFGHSRMWAQYGEAHKGVCLIFDRAQLHQAIRENLTAGCNLYYGPVEYSEKISGSEITSTALDQREIARYGLEQFLNLHRHRYHHTFFFTKSKDWSGEFEYRWVVIGDHDESEFVPIDKAIAGVVVGVDFRRVYFPCLIPLCKELKIPAARIGWQNGVPLLTTYIV